MKFLKYFALFIPVLAITAYFMYQKFPVNPPIKVSSSAYEGGLNVNGLQMPEGFKVDVYADSIENARAMCLSPSGTLFVGTRSKGNVYAIVDTDKDGRGDKKYTLLTEGNMPNGVALKDGD